MMNAMTVTEMTDQIVAECGDGVFHTTYTAPLSLDMKEVVTLMQLLDHASNIIKLDRGMNPASAEYFNRLTVMLFGRLLGLNKQYIALQNAAVQDQAENTALPDDDGESWKESE
jgi:hypothetical protein